MADRQGSIWVGGKEVPATFHDDDTFTYEQDGNRIHAGKGENGNFYRIPEGSKFIAAQNKSFVNDDAYENWRKNNPNAAYQGEINPDSYQSQIRSTNQSGVVTNGYGQVQWDETVKPSQYKQKLREMRRAEYRGIRDAARQARDNEELTYKQMRQRQRAAWKGTYGSMGGNGNQLQQDAARYEDYKSKYQQEGLKRFNARMGQNDTPAAGPAQAPVTQGPTVSSTPTVSRPYDRNAPTFKDGGKLSYFDYLYL